MKTCTYCGRENDEAYAVCRECGTEFNPLVPPSLSDLWTWRILIVLGSIALLLSVAAVVAMPHLIIQLVIVFWMFAGCSMPVYLPLLLSFAFWSGDWREIRGALRIASLASLLLLLIVVAWRTEHGNDGAGSLADAAEKFAFVWGGGFLFAVVAAIVGVSLRAARLKRSGEPANDCLAIHSETLN